MAKIFISYRRDDTAEYALSLRRDLASAFGDDAVFRDEDTLGAGDWQAQIDHALLECKVALVLIGPTWLTAKDAAGTRRLAQPKDVHRHEVARALSRRGVTVIPVLVGGAQVPAVKELPRELRPLMKLEFRQLASSAEHREVDLRILVRDIERATGRKAKGLLVRAESVLPPTTEHYLAQRGPFAHREFTGKPGEPWESPATGELTVRDLRARLLERRTRLRQPVPVKVRGTLLPCALLSSGWWEKHSPERLRHIRWRDSVQEWLFHGFELWGPSWDFTWNFEQWERSRSRPHFIAQLGDGDEANSLPVLVPQSKATKLQGALGDKLWRGLEAVVVGVLGHRAHFSRHIDPKALELFGGLLDYCLWIDEQDPKHGIQPLDEDTEVYSGYLWKCVAPKAALHDHQLTLRDVYFLWEHTNFASPDAIKYNLDSLQRKEEYIAREHGELVLVQKSSVIVPGDPRWTAEDIYDLLTGKRKLAV